MKTKMALFVSGSLRYLICAEDEKNGSSSSKEEGIPASQVRCCESCHTKTTTELIKVTHDGHCVQSHGRALCKNFRI